MVHSYRVLTAALVLCVMLASAASAQRLLEIDGVELHGTAQLVMSGGGTCNVLESDTAYDEKKGNDGAPMDVWRLDFSVRNGSGRWLDHLIARFQIESEWPDCTNWDGPEAGEFPQNIEWADSIGHIQESGRNVVGPGETLTETKHFIVLQGDPPPQFANWSMDFDFAVNPPPADSQSGAPGSPATTPTATPEQENLFWQSIMNSTNPTMFEAYLEQFPNGVLGRARRGAVNNGVAISGVKKEGILRHRCRHRPVQYLNNILAQDHRRAKGRLCPMLGFKTFYNARRVIIGIELAQNIHKRQFAIPITWQSKPAMIWRFWMFARC